LVIINHVRHFPNSIAVLRSVLPYVLLLISFTGLGKDQPDSLRQLLHTNQPLPEKITTYLQMAQYFCNLSMWDSALVTYQEALQVQPNRDTELNYKIHSGIAKSYHRLEKLPEALRHYLVSVSIATRFDLPPGDLADLYKDVGRTYYEMARYDSAMTNYIRAQKIYETNDIYDKGRGSLLHYIGSVFKRQGDMDKACDYYQQQYEYGQKYHFDDIFAEGLSLHCDCIDDDTLVLRRLLLVLSIYEGIGNLYGLSIAHSNVGYAYENLGMVDSAFYHLEKSVEQGPEVTGYSGRSKTLSGMAGLLVGMKRYAEAEKLLEEAKFAAEQTDTKRLNCLVHVYRNYFELNRQKGNFKAATEYLLIHEAYKDSVLRQDHKSDVMEMELIYETEKKEAEIKRLEIEGKLEQRESELARSEAARQSANKTIYMTIAILVLIMALYILVRWRQSLGQKRIINAQKIKVEQQKKIIERKNKDVSDSMNYASTIQAAALNSGDNFAMLFSDYFVLYKPRDIVSGDFYWTFQPGPERKFIAVGDCTGHGVPGAMMSMLGMTFLNDVIVESKEEEPERVLNKMRQQIKNALNKKGTRDGMDMALCRIDGLDLAFSGANSSVYILRNGEIIELKGDKQPIGYHDVHESDFSVQHVKLQKNDRIYLFSDGYADQFGGPNEKKYKYKTFKEKLVSLGHHKLSDQEALLHEEFTRWKGRYEQVDDVCVVGILV
jgi:serine phosphatase RsbU (regulator of sigma subunit)